MEFRRGVGRLSTHIRPLVKRTSEDDSETVRLVVTQRTDDKWGDASRGTSPTDTQGLSVELCQNKKTDKLPSGRWQDKQTPIAFVLKLLLLGTPLARTVDTLLTDACEGCIIACKSTYRGVHIGNVLIIHHFFERHFATGF